MEFKPVKLKEIVPDPNQPRQFYDESAMQELVESVKTDGILQPILLRPSGKKMMIVFGERRYRAAEIAGLKEIPAMVREMTDDEALQAQIVENLQRKDVQPMEEAVAFISLMEKKGWSAEEVAARVGKSVFYVRQRVKLNNLIDEFKKLCFHEHISIALAVKISALSHESQRELYNDNIDEDDLENGRIHIDDYRIKAVSGKLSEAKFDINNSDLLKGVPACTSCPHNSSVMQLFPDSDNDARCGNISCYKMKEGRSYELQIEEVKNDPSMVFVFTSYGGDKSVIADFEKKGIKVYVRDELEDIIESPKMPDFEEFKDENEDYYDTEQEMMEAYNSEVKEYEDSKSELESGLNSGKYLKAFVVSGYSKGEFVYVELNKNAGAPGNVEVDENTAKYNEIVAEINRIKTKEARSKELDSEKIYQSVKQIYENSQDLFSEKRDCRMSQHELVGAIVALWQAGGYQFRKWMKKKYGFDEYNLNAKSLNEINNITEFGLNDCLFHFMKEKLPQTYGSHIKNGVQLAMYNITKEAHAHQVAKIELEAEESIAKRVDKVNKRLKELLSQQKELSLKISKSK